ncbi:MAG: hypothetical protein EP344_14595 [Bacteroidetes bacterium]|nr:MAG: hypothetical protein EP344_14595 [Bacteroidota bacterium]
MAQVGWVFLDDFGNRNRIGLYHGDRTGHLLLHCDLRIIQVDFAVKESRTYSFFIEDELCEVHVIKEPKGFSYEFEVNKKVDTPRNRLRRKDDRRNLKYIAILVGAMVLVVSSLFFGLRWWNQQQIENRLVGRSMVSGLSPENERLLAAEGRTAIARLVLVQEDVQRRVFYGFLTEDKEQVSGRFYVRDTGQVILPNGFPLSDSDAFTVRYLPGQPQIHKVDFEQPTANTLAGYLEQARLAEVRAHPKASPGHSLCVAKLTLEQKGWHQLADLIFQSVPPDQNPEHNQNSYLRLIREPEFAQQIAKGCWDQ